MRKGVGLVFFWLLVGLSGVASGTLDGIWKDVPVGQSNDRVALFLQTNSEGAILAIVLDSSGGSQHLYAFLDSDSSDGFNAVEIGGADAHLGISDIEGESTALAMLKVAQNALWFPIYKWFESPDQELKILNGIYKDAPVGGNTSFNLYFQTYSGVSPTSAVAVVTNDGGSTYYAFLDPDISDGFDAGDVLQEGSHLTIDFAELDPSTPFDRMDRLLFDQTTTTQFAFTRPGTPILQGTLYKWFQAPDRFDIESSAFDNGDMIPAQYTADGEGISPPLNWRNVMPGTQSFVLIVEDITASGVTHWIVYDIPKSVFQLKEDATSDLPVGAKQGVNGATQLGYLPMDPPPQSGVHQYFFRLYALNIASLDITGIPTRSLVESAMKGHIIDSTDFFATYVR